MLLVIWVTKIVLIIIIDDFLKMLLVVTDIQKIIFSVGSFCRISNIKRL